MSRSSPWWEAAFGADYAAVYRHRDLDAARSEVRGLLELGLGGRVLDLACGWGRHLLALRERGIEAWGMDRSPQLLARAPSELRGRLVRGDLRELPFASGSFDGVAMLFSSFGYFEEREDRAVLGEVARTLRAGGLLVLDLMNAARVRATLVPESRTERDGWLILERRQLAQAASRVRKEVLLRSPEGAERRWTEDVRLYSPVEVDALARSQGLEPERWVGDFDGSSWSPAAPRAIALLRRP